MTDPHYSASSLERLQCDPGPCVAAGAPVSWAWPQTLEGGFATSSCAGRGAIPAPGPPRPSDALRAWPGLCGGLATSTPTSSTAPS